MPRKLPRAAPAPVDATIGEGPDSIVLLVCQDAYNANAQYTVSADGQQVGGALTASAWRLSGRSDTVTIRGDWDAGAHTIEVAFLNDAWGGSAGTDRNLHVNSVAYNGVVVSGGPTALYTTGTATFVAEDATPTTLSAIGGHALRQTFGDEFDGFAGSPTGRTASGQATWQTTYFWGARTMATNNEAQYYSDSTTAVDPFAARGGVLDITAAPNASLPDGLTYTSGMITTHESFSQRYGYFEMRAQLPAGQGMWPAFWLLPESGRWPPELDAMEMLGSDPRTVYMATHTGPANTVVQNAMAMDDASAGLHTYGVAWRPDEVAFYVDGQEVFRTPTPADMHEPMYMLANLAVGGPGSWPGPAAGGTATMRIDHIRAYQFDDLV